MFSILMTQSRLVTYFSVNSPPKDVHGKVLTLQNMNKGLEDNCFGSSARSIEKGSKVKLDLPSAQNEYTFAELEVGDSSLQRINHLCFNQTVILITCHITREQFQLLLIYKDKIYCFKYSNSFSSHITPHFSL